MCASLLFFNSSALTQDSKPKTPQTKTAGQAVAKMDADAEIELQKALDTAGNDRRALVRNLKGYLQRFPDAPRKADVYRALVEACEQLRDSACAVDYAERLIAVHPDDSEMMLLAVNLLNQQGDDASLTRAAGYITRVLDRVEKSSPEERPAHESTAGWQDHKDSLRTALYYMRGQVERSQHNYDSAIQDLQTSFSIRPSPLAAEQLGEIAELRKDSTKAIEEYLLAFVLPEDGPAGKVDRHAVRMELGNIWRQVHGSEQGLGEAILAAYDHVGNPAAATDPAARNKDAKEPFAFVLRHVDGTAMPLAALKGKVVVLSFWATWCGPCQELEPLFDQVAKNYSGNSSASFLAVNTDDDESVVPAFLARKKWSVPVAYADGLDEFMKVESLPTVLVLDAGGKIAYRADGYDPEGFTESLIAAIQGALTVPH